MKTRPIIFVVDVSESMVGEPMETARYVLKEFSDQLASNAYALEAWEPRVFFYAGSVLGRFAPQFGDDFSSGVECGVGSSFGTALERLMKELDAWPGFKEQEQRTYKSPLVVFILGSNPRDNCFSAIDNWRNDYADKLDTLVIRNGASLDLSFVRELSDELLYIPAVTSDVIQRFIDTAFIHFWGHWSVSTDLVLEHPEYFTITNILVRGVEKICRDEPCTVEPKTDYMVLRSRCSKTKQDYLVKFARKPKEKLFDLVGAYPVDGERFEMMSDFSQEIPLRDSGILRGHAVCPCCGNESVLVHCGRCGKFHCASGDDPWTVCPWCGNEAVVEQGRFRQ